MKAEHLPRLSTTRSRRPSMLKGFPMRPHAQAKPEASKSKNSPPILSLQRRVKTLSGKAAADEHGCSKRFSNEAANACKAGGRLTTKTCLRSCIPTGGSKRCPARPHPTNAPETYPQGTLRMHSRGERRRTAFSDAVRRGSSAAPSAELPPDRIATKSHPHAPRTFPNPPRSVAAHRSA